MYVRVFIEMAEKIAEFNKRVSEKIKGTPDCGPILGVWDYTVILTYMSLVSAVIGMTLAVDNKNKYALICLIISGICDLFDGIVARTKKNRTDMEKRFGIQIDSLSDTVAFGVLPATIGFSMSNQHYPVLGQAAAALFVLGAVVRLAYFNVAEEERQSIEKGGRKYYQGLPVTSSALILPLVYCITYRYSENILATVYSIALIVIAIMFVSNVKVKKPKGLGICILSVIGMLILGMVLVWL